MLGVGVVYLGLIIILLGGVSSLKLLGIRTRRCAALFLALGLVLVAVGWALPAKEVRVVTPRTQLDHFVPVYQFHERHSVRIQAPREQVYRAIKSVRAGEIFLFRTLTWIRRFGRSGPESILNAPEQQPLLDVVTKTSFILLSEEPNREIVVGTIVAAPSGWQPGAHSTPEDFRALQEPGFALAALNFLIEDAGEGACQVTTETRVYATDAAARRRFAVYWRIIYPGSALIRRMWLRAISRRAASPRA